MFHFNPIVLCYHEISIQNPNSNPWIIDPNLLDDHFQILNKYRDCVSLSFDDGRIGCWIYGRSLLLCHGFDAIFYINIDMAEDNATLRMSERYSACMHWDHIKDLLKGKFTIGSHSYRHERLDVMSDEQQMEELVDSRQMIRERLGLFVSDFAAPYGYLPHLSIAKAAGYRTVASVYPRRNYIDEPMTANPLVVNRWPIRSDVYSDLYLFDKHLNSLIETGELPCQG